MDNITHSLVGLMLARVGLEKTAPHGTAMMMLAANAPDIDAIFWFAGTQTYIEWHRSYPHAVAFMPLVALLPLLLARVRFSWQAYLASMIGVFSHLLLDWTNSYGVPLALPFSWHRFRLDIANVFDAWIWGILIIGVVVVALSRSSAARRGWAWVALATLLVFEGVRLTAHEQAIEMMSRRQYQGARPQSVTVLPGFLKPLEWRGVIEGRSFVIVLPVDVVNGTGAETLYRTATPIPAMDAAMRTRPFQVFSSWSQLPFWKVTPVEDGLRLDLVDLRFGTPDRPGFASVTAIVDRSGRVVRAGFGI
ncbi:MAG: metal-dependent hydrolase [Acidobacteriota bacterium]